MWRSDGWPAKVMPNISHVSRSCQSAPAYAFTHVPTGSASRASSRTSGSGAGSGIGASGASTSDTDGVASPTSSHVFVLDALLQEHDAFEQRLGARRAARHVDVDGDDLVDALGDRVAV